MAFTYTVNNLEYNGGAAGIALISTSSYVAPAAYTSYVQFGATDGIEMTYTTETEEVLCDQVSSAIDIFKKMTSCVVKLTLEETTLINLTKAMGYASADIVASLTEHSMYSAGDITASEAYFGNIASNLYYDFQFEKAQSHDTTKVIGFRLPMCTPTGNLQYNSRHGEKNFYDVEYKALIFNLDSGATYYNKMGYWFDQTS